GTFPGGTAPGGALPGGTVPGGTTRTQPPVGGQVPGGGAMGGLLNASTSSAAVTRLLKEDAGDYTWVAATIGSNSASGYQVATQLPVMPIGGFNGSDPSPTLSQFKALVAAGKIHYFIGGGGLGGPGGMSAGSSAASAISTWVANHFSSTTVDGVTL